MEPGDDVGGGATADGDDVAAAPRPVRETLSGIVRAMDGAPEAYGDVFMAAVPERVSRTGRGAVYFSPSDSNVAFPPTAAVLIVTVCSVAKRGR